MTSNNGITVELAPAANEPGTRQLFAFKGTLTFETVMELWKTKEQFFSSDLPIAFDLKDVKRTDSAGLALLMALFREATARHKRLCFVNIPKQLIDIASVSGVESILPIYPAG